MPYTMNYWSIASNPSRRICTYTALIQDKNVYMIKIPSVDTIDPLHALFHVALHSAFLELLQTEAQTTLFHWQMDDAAD